MLSVADDPKVYHKIIDNAKEMLYEFDVKRYYPFLVAAAEAIRKVDKTGIIFSENCYYSNLGIPCSVPRIVYRDGTREENHIFRQLSIGFSWLFCMIFSTVLCAIYKICAENHCFHLIPY